MVTKFNIFLSLLLASSIYISILLVYQTKSSIHSKNNTASRKPDESSPSALLLIGAGNVGYPLLHALALDSKTPNMFSKIIILDAQPEKPDEIQFLQQELHMEYKYIQGDMRDEFLLHQIFNETHIKGVIVLAAVSRVMWCEIEKETCQQINTHAIRILMKQITLSNSNPWIIFASSREVYGAVKEFPITETTQMNPLNLYGRTKMKAEHILTSYNKKPLHKIILRFSSIYGGKYDHSDRLIPSMIRSMLNDQPIPFSGSNQEFDFTYIDDVVDAIKLAIHQAEELTILSDSDIGTLTKYNICSGELTSVKKLYQMIKYLTNSYSPVIMFDNNGVFPDKYEASTKYTADKLGFKARVNIRNGLLAYIHQIYTISHQQIQKQLQISTSFNENEDIKSLDECSVIFNFKNQAHEFNLKVNKEENNQIIIPVLDVGPKTITENNKTIIIESGPSKFILKVDSFSRSLVLLDAKEPSKYYEMDKKSSTEWDSKSYPYKIHIHCCPNLVNYPFASFSPYFLSNIDYPQRNNPTLSNAKLEQAIKYKTHEIQRLVDLRTAKLVEDNILSNYSMNANDWTQSSKDHCETNCKNIIPCLKRDNCRCVINEQCSHSSMSIPSFITSSPLYDQRLSLLSVYGRSVGMKWPKIYVHDFEQTQKFLSNSNCGKQLTGGHCFTMDAVLYYSFKNISVPIEQADIVMLPFFHGCSNHYGFGIGIDSYILKELDNLKAKYPNKIFTTMASHDYGGCGEFWWSYLEANNPKQKESHFKMVTIQPNGDYFSKCYIPEKDIVAPPRSCLTNRLIEKFGDEKSVKKVTERKHLVFFEGSLFGTGKVTRKTLKECSNVFGFLPKNQYSDYLEMLSETKFCPLVAGTTGWATRNSDVIYAGCIPVYLSEYTHQPFANLLDYSKFSIQIHPSQVYNLKSILESISEERMIELQRNVLLVRDLMIYKNEESVKEWSPQDMVLRELYIRLKTRFETK